MKALTAAFALAAGLACAVPAIAGQGAAEIDYETARLERRLTIVRATAPIVVDGRLEEPDWVGAPVAREFIQNEPQEGQPATHDTEVRVLYDEEAIYFGVFARDAEPGGIIVNDLKKDFNTGNSDGVRVIIDTFRDARNGYQFAVNTDSKQWSSNLRFNLIHRPLSDIFLVYNERHDDRFNRTDRALVAKMTYLMAL